MYIICIIVYIIMYIHSHVKYKYYMHMYTQKQFRPTIKEKVKIPIGKITNHHIMEFITMLNSLRSTRLLYPTIYYTTTLSWICESVLYFVSVFFSIQQVRLSFTFFFTIYCIYIYTNTYKQHNEFSRTHRTVIEKSI